jgi:plastocyanin
MRTSVTIPLRSAVAMIFVFAFTLAAAANSVYAQQVTVSGRVDVVKQGKKTPRDNSNVVVWLTPVSRSAMSKPKPSQHVRLIQKNKSFEPHVLVVPVGSIVEFPNEDPFFHNVFSLFEGKRFDLGLYESGGTRLVRFDRAGICYIFCNIHPEMSAVVLVLDTPYYAMSDRAGQVTIPEVPPGRYILHSWHEGSNDEELKSLAHEITVSAIGHSFGVLHVPESNVVRLAHKNKYGRDYDNPTPVNPVYERP